MSLLIIDLTGTDLFEFEVSSGDTDKEKSKKIAAMQHAISLKENQRQQTLSKMDSKWAHKGEFMANKYFIAEEVREYLKEHGKENIAINF